jgi:RHS repeat-associated protein
MNAKLKLHLLLLAGLPALSSAATLSGTCKVSGLTFSGGAPCETIFAFTSAELSYSDCQLYKSQLDGETCRAIAPSDACNYLSGQLLSASCSGGGGGGGSWFDGAGLPSARASVLDPFGAESGSAFFSRHYGSGFEDWRDDAAERWRSYLARNAIGKATGIAIWPDDPLANGLEWLYARLSGGKERKKVPASLFPDYDNAPVSKAQSDYERGLVDHEMLRMEDPPAGSLASPVPPPGNMNHQVACAAQNSASIAPAFGVEYNSMYGGRSETTGMKIELFPDGRAIYTDAAATRWTFRPYGETLPDKGDAHYRAPPGFAGRLVYGGVETGRGWRVEKPDGDVLEFSAAPSTATWRPSRYNAADGSWLDYAYGPAGLARITDMHGRYFDIERDARGLPLRVSDQNGRATTFAYDQAGRVTGMASPDGREKRFTYDAAGLMNSVKDGALAEKRFTYDRAGRLLTSELDGGINRLEHYYDDASSRTIVTDALGAKTVYRRKTAGGRDLVSSVTDALGGTVSLEYDRDYQIAAVTDQAGRLTRYSRNSNGDPETITDALGASSTIEYQVKLRYRDAAGDHTDHYSRPVRVTDALGRASTMDYDKRGNLSRLTDALGNKTGMKYDKAGHLLELRDALGATYKYEYDLGLARSVDPLGRVTKYKRDEDLRVTRLIDPMGRGTSFTYDPAGNVTSVANPQGFVTRFSYGSGTCASCAGGQLASLTDPKGNTWAFNYDKYGRLADTADPLGRKKAYQYDRMSRATAVKDPAGNINGYTYDALGRLIKKEVRTPSGDRTVTGHAYDPVGNMLSAADGGSRVEFAYDALNRPVKTAQTFGGGTYAITYAYDAVGNRTGMTTPWGEYNYTYDALNRLTSIVNPQGINVNFAYDAVGRRTKKTIFKALPETLAGTDYTYDKAGQLLSIVNKAGGEIVSFVRYEYDAAGNRIAREDRDGRTTYSYDLANRLISAEGHAGAETFVYDDNGNRLSDKTAGNYAYDAANRIQANSLYTFNHDLSGNLTGRTARNDGTTITYAYNPEQKLSEVTSPEHRVQYKYDPLGRRIEKTVDGDIRRYIYDNEDIIAVLDGGNGLLRTFTHGPGIDEPLIMTGAGGANYYYHADALGSITALTDDNKEIVETYSYTAYGAPKIKDNTGTVLVKSAIDNTYFFTSRELDSESGLYYFRARYYDCHRGAFTQEDFVFAPNLFTYAGNSPAGRIDPYGMDWIQDAVNAGAGYGDGLTLGLTKILREKALGLYNVDYCSDLYKGELATGMLVTSVASFFTGGGASSGQKLYHYTAADSKSILSRGILPNTKGEVFLTPNGSLSPLQAQLDLALMPNRGLPGHLLEIDVAALQRAGFSIPKPGLIGRKFNMPGGGLEVILRDAIPPSALKLIR